MIWLEGRPIGASVVEGCGLRLARGSVACLPWTATGPWSPLRYSAESQPKCKTTGCLVETHRQPTRVESHVVSYRSGRRICRLRERDAVAVAEEQMMQAGRMLGKQVDWREVPFLAKWPPRFAPLPPRDLASAAEARHESRLSLHSGRCAQLTWTILCPICEIRSSPNSTKSK
jgi:hypothetical protein